MTTALAKPDAPPADPPSRQWRMLAKNMRNKDLPRGLDLVWASIESTGQQAVPRRQLFMRRAGRIMALAQPLTTLADAELRDRVMDMHDRFRLGRDCKGDLDTAYALITEVAFRQLGLRPHQVQIAAALALNAGCCAELATGEGKTLSAVMPATVAGWRGRGCHVITVNDYLARRDAESMTSVFTFCGVSVASIDQEMDPIARRAAYACDVTYTTNKEVAADFLRDRLNLGRNRRLPAVLLDKMTEEPGLQRADRLVMRGLEYAIIDEADSILIDEAVTPLIISGDGPNAEQVEAFEQAADLAKQMDPQTDMLIDHRWREVRLTRAGHQRLDALSESLGGIWAGRRRREELVVQALTALHLYIPGQQYVVQYDEQDERDKVVIVDEFTGRLMPDRTWRDGLHQAVEAKEGLPIQPMKQTLARISFQRFFRMYRRLSGMTGTAWEARAELWQTYRMPVVRIPTHRPCIRKQHADRVYLTDEDRWAAIVEHIRELNAVRIPVLVGTRSVEASERLSELLTEAGLDHQVLNAVRHKEEAQIVAGAGQPGRITVATNMAGRGTDIKLGRDVAELGGLHVIATERHESGRIDRQLFGRAGRQGDPGSAISIVSCDDELVRRHLPPWMRSALRSIVSKSSGTSARAARAILTKAQRRAMGRTQRQRRAVLRSDEWLDEYLSFAGPEM